MIGEERWPRRQSFRRATGAKRHREGNDITGTARVAQSSWFSNSAVFRRCEPFSGVIASLADLKGLRQPNFSHLQSRGKAEPLQRSRRGERHSAEKTLYVAPRGGFLSAKPLSQRCSRWDIPQGGTGPNGPRWRGHLMHLVPNRAPQGSPTRATRHLDRPQSQPGRTGLLRPGSAVRCLPRN